MLVDTKAKVGVFSIALGAYLPQFPQLVPEFEGQYAAFKKTIPDSVELIDGGMVTTKEQAMAAGDKFRAADVDLVFLQMLTYATSYNVLPAVRDLDVPVVIVNVQKKKAPDYANTDIPTWLGTLYACGATGEVVGFSNVLVLSASMRAVDDYGRLAVELTGSGTGYLATGGTYVPIKWSRSSVNDCFTYTLEDGTPLELARGTTFAAIIPTDGGSVDFS